MLRLLAGRAGTGKTERVLREIARQLRDDPLGPPIFLIVPDQAAFHMERLLTERAPGQSVVRAQVLGFRRLAWQLREDLGGAPLRAVREAGKHALLGLAYEEVLGGLTALRRSAGASEQYTDRLLALVEEFQSYGLTAESLAAASLQGLTAPLARKLQDVSAVMKRYGELIDGRFVDPYDLLPHFAKRAREWDVLQGAAVYVDGFLEFTPQELDAVGAIGRAAGFLTVTVTAPPERVASWLSGDGAGGGPDGPFASARDTCGAIGRMARREELSAGMEVQRLEGPPPRFSGSSALRLLEERLFLEEGDPAGPGESAVPIRIVLASDRDAEVADAASRIAAALRSGTSPGDCLVIVSDFDLYRGIVGRVFNEFGIPHFMDVRRSIRHHPVASLLMAVLEAAVSPDAPGPYLRTLRTDLLPVNRRGADALENYALRHGLGFRDLVSGRVLPPGPREAMRAQRAAAAVLAGPFAALAAAGDVREQCAALWALLENAKVPRRLRRFADGVRPRDPAEARLHEAAFDGALQVLDDLVEILGDRSLPAGRLAAAADRAFRGLTAGLIPPGLNQVLVTAVDRVRAVEAKEVFILGCNEGLFPRTVAEGDLLGDRDRAALFAAGIEVARDSRTRQSHERIRVYNALTRAKRQLTLSAPLTGEGGRPTAPSWVLGEVRSAVPRFVEEGAARSARTGDDATDEALCLTPERGARHLAEALRGALAGAPLTPLWTGVYRAFADGSLPRETGSMALAGLAHDVGSERLPPPLAARLYGPRFEGSSTRLERFGACPFAHFAAYGLRLKPRETARADARARGSVLHEALRRFFDGLLSEGLFLAALEEADARGRLRAALFEAVAQGPGKGYLDSARGAQELRRMESALDRALDAFREYSRRTRFSLFRTELGFGSGGAGDLPPFAAGSADNPAFLRGRIDRLDVAQAGSRSYFIVVDYKSSARRLELDDVWHGLSVQLPLYARFAERDGAAALGEEWTFAGMFYFPLKDSLRPVPVPETAAQAAVRNRLRFSGLVSSDPGVIGMLDRDAARSGDLFGRLLKQDGTLRKGARAASAEEWEMLGRHVERIAGEFNRRIFAGETDIAPYRKRNGSTACDFCEFHAVCQIEPGFSAVERRLEKLGERAVWDRLAEAEQAEAGQAEAGQAEAGQREGGVSPG